ncbi:MAG TPA: peptidoglycan-binding domain-containing protein [Gammaproteobacteria bacterium]|nr:peptidoglycan-binding domain-containing protein [Gammaproteobacteria bacterium]
MLFVPDKTPKNAGCGTEQKHTFKRKGVPAKLKIRLLLDDEPRANEPYHLTVDGRTVEGATDSDGFLEEPIPPGATRGQLRVGAGPVFDVFELALGTLDPIDTDSGVEGRLQGLGYPVHDDDLAPAIRAFQADEQLTVTGRVDAGTRDLLQQRFGQ